MSNDLCTDLTYFAKCCIWLLLVVQFFVSVGLTLTESGTMFCFSWPDIDWTSLYWDGVDRARAVQSMLEAGETDSQNFQKYHNDELMKHHSRAN